MTLFVGNNYAFYARRWAESERLGGVISWNWAAFFVSLPWLAYRKMYWHCGIIIAALILAFAGPVWKPVAEPQGQGPLLIVMDAGWAAAPDWPQRQTRALRALDRASGAGQAAALLVADGREDGALPLQPASEVAARLRALVPAPWETRYPGKLDETLAGMPETGLNVLWLSDGLDHPGRGGLLSALGARGGVTVVPPLSAPQSLELVAGERPALRLRVAGAGAGNTRGLLLNHQGAADKPPSYCH